HQPNSAGWYNSNVTIAWQCNDALSGIASCPGATTLTSEGASQIVTGTATDRAGNVSPIESFSINIDKTVPTITLNTPPSLAPSAVGDLISSASDNLSGIASFTINVSLNSTLIGAFTSPQPQLNFTVPATAQPGDTITVTAIAVDFAGNTATAN